MCAFIVEFAGIRHLNILKFLVREEDDMGRTPFYWLCVKGYEHKFSAANQRKYNNRKKIIEKLIPPQEERIKDNPLQYSRWDFVSAQLFYTPLHWLAYWNDSASIHYLLHLVPNTLEDFKKIFAVNYEDLCALDIAGMKKCDESAQILIDFLKNDFDKVVQCFSNLIGRGNKVGVTDRAGE